MRREASVCVVLASPGYPGTPRAGLPIEGVAALPRGRTLPRPARVRVTFGPPLTFKRASKGEGPREGKRAGDDGRKEAYREAAQEMMRAIGQLRDQQARSCPQAQH